MPKYRRKVQVHIYRPDGPGGAPLFLVVQKPRERGGFWQPVTGNAEKHERFIQTARREVMEETGLTDLLSCNKIGEFTFEKSDQKYQEAIFVAESGSANINLSKEHVAYKWLDFTGARKLIHFESNKTALDTVMKYLKETL